MSYQGALAGAANNNTSSLMRKIAIASGIDPDQTVDSLADKALKKRLGSEAVHISSEIFDFLLRNPAPTSLPREGENFDESTSRSMEEHNRYVSLYQKEFSGTTLSLLDRLDKLGLGSIDRLDRTMFKYPTNPLDMQQVAKTLGRIGNTLLDEAK